MRTGSTFLRAVLLAAWLASSLLLPAESNDIATNVAASATSTNLTATNTAATNPTANESTNAAAPVAVADKPTAPQPESPPAPEPKPEPAASGTDFSSFRIVSDRNIFNGNRAAGSGVRFTSTRSSTIRKDVVVESFTLVGTLLSSRGMTAFFDGSSPEFQAALRAGEKYGAFVVKEVLHAGVCLQEGTNTIEIAVGSGMRREDQGLWKLSETGTSFAASWSSGATESSFRTSDNNSSSRRTDYSSRSSRGSSRGSNGSGRSSNNESSSGSSSPPAASSSSVDVDAVLKRLMEQRAKE